MPQAGPSASRPGEIAGVLRLLAYLVAAAALMVLDYRGGWLHALRMQGELLAQPLWWLAAQPAQLATSLRENAVSRRQLIADNARLRRELLLAAARNARLQMVAAENARLRGLLDSAARARLDVQLAGILDVDLDPTRQRLLLDSGRNRGVRVGQVVIDAGGLLGQVIATTANTATVLLVTDPDHAVPVMVARSGVRLVVYGTGRSDLLHLADVPLSADVREGDELLTSGLGDRFPPGFAVGRIARLRADDSRAFLEADVIPAAQLDRGRDVLLLRGFRPPVEGNAATSATGPTAETTAQRTSERAR
ncbi:rod shape-determining protein MreC [Thermomonas alba]|uniref:rod shape-determining protein MreC n=1 Tax=Thermomonas alba TaxID=2888525 RepID=UPI003F70469D